MPETRLRRELDSLIEQGGMLGSFRPLPEHLGEHGRLFFQIPRYNNPFGGIGFEMFSNYESEVATLRLLEDIFDITNGVKVHVILPDMSDLGIDTFRRLNQSADMFGPVDSSFGQALRDHSLEFSLYKTDRASQYLRDTFMFGYDVESGSRPVVSLAHSFLTSDILMGRTDRYIDSFSNIAVRAGCQKNFLPLIISGGNFMVSQDWVMTLSDTVKNNCGILSNLFKREIPFKEMEEYMRDILGPGFIVLDKETRNLNGQDIYHLDLAMAMLPDGSGGEVAVLASHREAKKVLKSYRLMPKAGFSMKRWLKLNSYEDQAAEAKDKLSDKLKHLETIGLDMTTFAQYKTLLGQIYQHPGELLEMTGRKLHKYFGEQNNPIQDYLDVIHIQLEKMGIRVIEVPALLPYDRVSRRSNNSDRYPAPIYCPVNGIVFRNMGKSSFITVGGIPIFDQQVQEALSGTVDQVACLSSALPFGEQEAGIHCLSLVSPPDALLLIV